MDQLRISTGVNNWCVDIGDVQPTLAVHSFFQRVPNMSDKRFDRYTLTIYEAMTSRHKRVHCMKRYFLHVQRHDILVANFLETAGLPIEILLQFTIYLTVQRLLRRYFFHEYVHRAIAAIALAPMYDRKLRGS